MAGPRLTISPNKSILDALDRTWPLHVPKHRLMRLALERGLEQLASVDAEEFRRIVFADAVASSGVRPHE